MTVLRLADAGEAADLAAFLGRLIHYDRAAAVRLQAQGSALAVFGRPPSFEVLAVRTARLAGPAPHRTEDEGAPDGTLLPSARRAGATTGTTALAGPGLDVTVSAGALLEGVTEDETDAVVTVPESVTGPPWAGMLPPRQGWRRLPGLPGQAELRAALAAAVREFRARDEALPPERRTRAERDRIGRDIWSRTLGATPLPLRAAHAAQSLGFLRPARATVLSAAPGGRPEAATGGTPRNRAQDGMTTGTPGADDGLVLFAAPGWLRLRTPFGAVALRTAGAAQLGLSPV
ncbi:hypothetical protein ACFV3R_03575 [Streptomyces sp. NPDC059740]|uniref:hypothetical protein n=1 Tax=Streptomyces sp. NPDC059740 TaxID=3346926 RepID=UPI0036486C9B